MFPKSISYQSLSSYINDERNLYKIFIALIIFLSLLKLPPLFSTDIQPWDEGMYATRVHSIEKFGDFLDQSEHSVGKYYSSTQPPLLIWLAYFITRVTGINAITLKLIVYIISIFALFLLIKLGKLIDSLEVGFLAAMIITSTLIFNIFSKRFQFDMLFVLMVLLSVYFFFKYIEGENKKYLYFTGIAAGLCIMSKLVVGVLPLIVFFCAYFFIRKTTRYTIKDFFIIVIIALAVGMPWYIYLIIHTNFDALKYTLDFHMYKRAVVGIEQNEKRTEILYYFNYFMNIVPFGILVFYIIGKNILNFKSISWKDKFLLIWFIVGFIIVSVTKSKLQSYTFLFFPPAALMIAGYIKNFKELKNKEKLLLFFLLLLNLIWYATENYRTYTKEFGNYSLVHKLGILGVILLILSVLLFFLRKVAIKVNYKKVLFTFVVLTFFVSNVYYLVKVPYWENSNQLSPIKEIVDKDIEKKLLYVSSNYKFNPQFSYYFNGADAGWGENSGYKYELADIKFGLDTIKRKLENLDNDYFILVEKDYINRAEYPDSKLFIPPNFTLITKITGYELYKNF